MFNKQIIILVLCLICVGYVLGSTLLEPSNEENRPQNPKVLENIRAGYMGSWNIDVLPQMANSGMNMALVKFDRLRWPIPPQQKKLIQKWAQGCKQHNIRFVPVVNLWGAYEKKWITLQYHLYYKNTKYDQTPCLLNFDFYKYSIHNRIIELAKLSRVMPIAGAAIDLEMYGANILYFPEYCLCDYCFDKFLSGGEIEGTFDESGRESYLLKNAQVHSYIDFTRNHLLKLSQQTKEKAELVSPRFLLGVLSMELQRTYDQGLSEGLSRGESPVFVFTEETYSKGYSNDIIKIQNGLEKKNINARLIVGIQQSKFPPEHLAEQYYYCSKDSAGYWVYTMESLSEKSKESLPFAKKLYWNAMSTANNELKKLADKDDYKSFLKIRPFKSPERKVDFSKLAVDGLEYVRPITAVNSIQKTVSLRFLNKIVFIAKKGQEIRFGIEFRKKRGNEYSSLDVVLISSKEDILVSKKASVLNDAELTLRAPYSGCYTIVINTYGNEARMESFSHLFSIATEKTAHFLKPADTLYLYRPAESSFAEILFDVDGIGESINAVFSDEHGKMLGKYGIIGRNLVKLYFEQDFKDEIIKLDIFPRPGTFFEDVRIQIKSGLEKYISPLQNGLVRQRK